MTSEELAAIRARVEAATPGPWVVDETLRGVEARDTDVGAVEVVSWTGRRDATFIAHARQDVPRLCDEVARLTAEVERLSAMVPRWKFGAPSRGELMVGECRIGSVVRMSPGDWSAWATDGDGAAWLYVCRAQTAESACAAVCRRLGLSYIAPPTEGT